MCAVALDSPDAQDSAPVYHFPNQYKMARRGDMFDFQNKTVSSAEVRVKGRVTHRSTKFHLQVLERFSAPACKLLPTLW